MADTPLAHERRANDKAEFRETLLIPGDKYPVPTDIEIYDNKVMIASWHEKLGIIIESKEVATTLRSVFRLANRQARHLDAER